MLTCGAVDSAVAIVAHALIRAIGVDAVARTNRVAKLQLTFVSICKKCTILIQDTIQLLVSHLNNTQKYFLRFWKSVFPQAQPRKYGFPKPQKIFCVLFKMTNQ